MDLGLCPSVLSQQVETLICTRREVWYTSSDRTVRTLLVPCLSFPYTRGDEGWH